MGINKLKINLLFLLIFFISIANIHNLFSQVLYLEPLNDRWALLIGISEYKEKNISLNYAHNDAQKFYNALISTCRFDKKNIRLLLNKDATFENIRKSIEGWLYSNTSKNDKILIFFSGHGTQDLDNNNDEEDGYDEFLVPYDFDNKDISSAIRDDMFAYWISSLKSENIILIFDSCYSGGAAKQKGFNHAATKGEIQVDSFINDIFHKDAIGEIPKKGVALIGASQDNQVSYEEEDFSMGLFTYYLIDSLNRASDEDQDSVLTIEEIFNVLQPKVIKYSKEKYRKEQKPILINAIASPFKLVFLPLEAKKDSTDKREIENMMYQARNATNSNVKINILSQICEKDPQNEGAHYDLALEYYYRYMYEDALYHFEICSALEKSAYTYLNIAQTHDKLGSPQDAILYATKAIELKPDYIDALNLLGIIYSKLNNYGYALNMFRKSLSFNQRQKEAYIRTAQVYISQKEYEEALKTIKKAQEINPDDYRNIYFLVLLHKYGIIKDIPIISNNLPAENGINLSFWSSMDTLIEDDKMRELFFNNAKKEIAELSVLIEPYIYLMKYYSKYEKNKSKAIEYYNKLVSMYPFIENDKQIRSLLK